MSVFVLAVMLAIVLPLAALIFAFIASDSFGDKADFYCLLSFASVIGACVSIAVAVAQ